MNILVIGDVVSAAGCEYLRSVLPGFKRLKNIDFCIANGENSAVGNGITPFSAQYLFDSGVDFLTTGNHVYRRREFYEMLDKKQSLKNAHERAKRRVQNYARLSPDDIINLAHDEYIENGVQRLKANLSEILNRQGIRYHGENCKGRISGYDHTVHGG